MSLSPNFKNTVDDLKAEIDFILLDAESTHTISPSDLSTFIGFVESISIAAKEEGNSFIDTFITKILLLLNALRDKTCVWDDSKASTLLKSFKLLPELVKAADKNTLDDEKYCSITDGCSALLFSELPKPVVATEVKKKPAEVNTKVEIILFTLNNVRYGIELEKIQEIIVFPEHITRIPGLRSMVLGVINLRGEVAPLVDTRIWFKTKKIEDITYSQNDIVIAVKNNSKITGLVVDEVNDVIKIDKDNLIKGLQNADIPTKYIQGFLNHSEYSFIVLLNIDRLLDIDNLSQIILKKK